MSVRGVIVIGVVLIAAASLQCRGMSPRYPRARRLLFAVLLLAGLLLLANCSSLGYVGQAAWGQGKILLGRQEIARLLEDPATPGELKEKLALVERIRDFAVAELHLPDNGSYRSYVELPPVADGGRRGAVVWNVVAAPELSTAPLTWCFPVAGCVSYRGYFSEARARRFGDRLAAEGYDVSVGGAAAYSTLGWFADPLLSTVIDYPEPYLAGLIFHELAHQVVYVQDDTRFNESFATTVEVEGVRRWLAAAGRRPAEMADYLAQQRRQDEVTDLLLAYRERLRETYGLDRADDWKRRRKSELFSELRQELLRLGKTANGEGSVAGAWARRRLNNADLASAGDYHGLVAGFHRLLDLRGGDLEAFYAAVAELAGLGPDERERRL